MACEVMKRKEELDKQYNRPEVVDLQSVDQIQPLECNSFSSVCSSQSRKYLLYGPLQKRLQIPTIERFQKQGNYNIREEILIFFSQIININK